jgi:tetratricopeptide (TPR) repeat protein
LALAGLIEIADREFQSIQDEDLELKNSIQRSLQDDLTRDALSGGPVKTGKNLYANKGKSAQSSVKVRDLIEMGKFSEAIAIYDDLIDAEPAAHTLYLGRAKAKFLAGDRVGALDDIYRAEKFNSNDPNVSVIKSRMIEGDIKGAALGVNNESSRLARMGKEALDAGKGVEAFEYFSQAEEKGYNKAFSLINKSVACILSSDVRGARYFVSQLTEIPGTPMQINVVAVNSIISAIEGVDNGELVDRLRTIVLEKPEYSLELSPINSIYINIEQFPKNPKEKMRVIFDVFVKDKK